MSERLDKIIERNARPHWTKSPIVRAVVVAVLAIVVLVLGVCTDLGQGKVPPKAAEPPKGPLHVDGVLLR